MEIEIKDHTKEAIDAKDLAIERALTIIGGELVRYSTQQCPVDTGLLRNSITFCLDGQRPAIDGYKADKEGRKGLQEGKYDGEMPKEEGKARAVYLGTNVEYAPIVEMSEKQSHTVGKAHFLRDALAQHMSEYNGIIARELKKAE